MLSISIPFPPFFRAKKIMAAQPALAPVRKHGEHVGRRVHVERMVAPVGDGGVEGKPLGKGTGIRDGGVEGKSVGA